MFIGVVTSRFPDGAVQVSLVYSGPSMENAKSVTQAAAETCTVETTWRIQDIGTESQFIANWLTESKHLGYLPPTPESKEIEENKD